MKIKKYQVEDRINHEYLGDGIITKQIKSGLSSKHIVAYMVKFDKTPDVRYNMGNNPCMVFADKLKSIK